MSKYQRITLEVRCQIKAYMQAGFSIIEISKKLSLHKTSVYRELQRNSHLSTYHPKQANTKARSRYRLCRRHYKVTPGVSKLLKEYLGFGWSPDQISRRFAKERFLKISHECIYQYIYRHTNLRGFLRRPRRKGFSRYSQTSCGAKNGLPIKDRPNIANDRGRIGDWERDLFYGANRKQVLVCTDRKSRFTKIIKLDEVNSAYVGLQTEKLIHSLPRKVYTVTNDNGSEFRGNKINIKTFFCVPRRPQQRGTVENTIGLIRQFIPKKTDLEKISIKQIQDIENKLNFRPRKCLDYKTPFEVFFRRTVALAN